MQFVSKRTKENGNIKLLLYNDPPTGDVSLQYFCSTALKRLHILRQLEWHRSRGKNWNELSNTILDECRKFLPSLSTQSQEPTDDDLRRDNISHFILRLAFCETEDQRRWFLGQEVLLFRIRFEALGDDDAKLFLHTHNLHYDSLTEAEWNSISDHLSTVNRIVQRDLNEPHNASRYFKVPFTKVAELVKKRQVMLLRGQAIIHHRDLAKVHSTLVDLWIPKHLLLRLYA